VGGVFERSFVAFVQVVVNGLLNGAAFGLVGAAFAFLFLTTRILSISLGALYVLAPYQVLAALRLGASLPIAVACSVLITALLAAVCEIAIHWPLERKRASAEVHLFGSLGAYLALVHVGVLVWGPDRLVFRNGLSDVYVLIGLRITHPQLEAFVCCLMASALFWALVQRTSLGLGLRALGSNPILLSTLGRNVQLYRAVAFAVSGAMVGLAACMTANDVGFDPNVGLSAVLVGFAATVLGGTTSLWGPIAAGVSLGIVRAAISWTAGAEWVDAGTFLLLVVSLVVLPQGLSGGFGRRRRIESET
jgi:branched-chain amino acid transport system permease protein